MLQRVAPFLFSRMSAYALLDQKLKHIQSLSSISGLLEWDEQVNLPAQSGDQRQDQLAVMANLIHKARTDEEIEALLAELETSENLSEDQLIVTRESRKGYDRSTKLPADFVEERTRAQSEAYHAWVAARKANDFESFKPHLSKQIELSKRMAEYLGWGDRPYDLMIDLHDPGMNAKTIASLFSDLKEDLIPLVSKILSSKTKAKTEIFRNFPIPEQKEFLHQVTKSLGFDYTRGRIDISPHPFCSGNGADIRMTTRFAEDVPLDSLFSSIHETGHGLYEQGLPRDQLHNALGVAAGMGVHESQSRLWENQVSRSRSFWKHFEPKFREAFPKQLRDISSDDLYLAINAVGKNPIRVDSDEVTYNLHIIIRFEVEQKLFSGELAISDLPNYWNNAYKEALGITPKDNAEGVLQDVHWSYGAFGYFPSYCLGNMLAAQLWESAREQLPNLEKNFETGDFSRLLNWLRSSVHAHGKRYTLMPLTEKVAGNPLSPAALIRYLEERYLPLYA